jgi:DhnA family fructose-bisphosphate aldolase class Ia
MGGLVLFSRKYTLRFLLVKLNHNELLTYSATPNRLIQVVSDIVILDSMLKSGGVKGTSDFKQAIRAAIINKRAGNSGIIVGRKAFQRTFDDG